MLTFLQLSDIHFRDPSGDDEGSGALDYEQREMLISDVRGVAEEMGGISAVLVCGDVANTGSEMQFGQARAWLTNLCSALEVPPWMVWTVPGNHDLDHSHINDEQLACRLALRSADASDVDPLFASMLADAKQGAALLAPLENYLDFASHYDCLFRASQLHWLQELPLSDSILALHGLTSCLICGRGDNMDENRMVIGHGQAQMTAEASRVIYTMCHHPHEWLLDPQPRDEYFDEHVNIRVTGHLHKRKLLFTQAGIHLKAGAVSPERLPDGDFYPGFEPRYDVIALETRDSDSERLLDVAVRARKWNDERRAWEEDETTTGSVGRRFTLDGDAPPTEIPILQGAPAQIELPPRELRYRLSALPRLDRLNCARFIGAPLGPLMDAKPYLVVDELFAWATSSGKTEELLQAVQRAEAGDQPGADELSEGLND